jgi:hypothetical protein
MCKNVLVVGYPKSGTTWLTRLTAEVLGCPVKGFWGEPDGFEIAVEGQERNSQYRCYKSHHQLHQIDAHSEKPHEAVIYLVRDPRDVVVSASRYFYPPRFGLVGRAVRRIPYIGNVFKDFYNTPGYRVDRMTTAILQGDAGVSRWCRVDWETHVTPYLESDHLFLRYEDLLDDAQQACRKIVDHLGIDRSREHLETSVYQQSMDFKKQKFLERGETEKANFMKTGTHGQWKDVLPLSHRQKIEQTLSPLLERVGYTTDSR